MGSFNIKDFLTENNITEVSKIQNLSKRLKESKGSETTEGKEIIEYMENEIELDEEAKNNLIESLDDTNSTALKSVYGRINEWKKKGYKVTSKDLKIINSTLR